MRFVALIAVILIASLAKAQKKPVYTASLEGGYLKGNNGKSSVYLFSNGVSYSNITAGIGAGIDNYLFRSVPLFLALRKDFGHHAVQPFLDYAVGLNLNAIKPEQRQYFDIYQNENVRNGFYTRAMFGASFRLHKKLCLYTGFGYSYKSTRVNYEIHNYSPEESIEPASTSYRMNRWNVIVGFRL